MRLTSQLKSEINWPADFEECNETNGTTYSADLIATFTLEHGRTWKIFRGASSFFDMYSRANRCLSLCHACFSTSVHQTRTLLEIPSYGHSRCMYRSKGAALPDLLDASISHHLHYHLIESSACGSRPAITKYLNHPVQGSLDRKRLFILLPFDQV